MKGYNSKFLKITTIGLAAILTIAIFSSYSNEDESDYQSQKNLDIDRQLPQLIRSVDLDKTFEFAGELLPMENFDVVDRLERELLVNSYWHSSTMLNIKSQYRYFPIMEPILAQFNVPDDFKYLSVIESNLRNETSPAGAKGFWQFMKPTAKYFGLEVNSEVDERFHLEKATEAACKYLLDYKRQFKKWSLAAAAYNMGGPNLKNALNVQKADNFYDLNLNAETNRYIFRIVAVKEILSNPEEFGFILNQDQKNNPLTDFHIVEVNGPIQNLGDFAKKQGTTYRMLKLFNPWLLSHKLTNTAGKTYQIKIPNK